MANLKELLGEDFKDGMTVEQVDEIISSKKLVDLSLGGYVSKEKYSAMENELKSTTENLDNSLSKIADLQKIAGDNKALSDEIASLKSDIENQKLDFEKRANAREREYISLDQIKGSGAKNIKAVKALLVDNFDFENAEIKDGKLNGLEEALKSLQETDGYLFNIAEEPKVQKAGRETVKPPLTTKEEEMLKLARKAAGLTK